MGQFWTPITPESGSFLHADLHDDGAAPVPEPGTLLLLGAGLAGLAYYRRKKTA